MASVSIFKKIGWVWILFFCINVSAQQALDLPLYQQVNDLPAGQLHFTGSESMVGLMLEWAQAFGQMYPQVNIVFNGGDSDIGFEALLKDPKVFLAPMSKELSSAQLADFRKAYGYEPVAIRVAIDAVGIYVHKDNPIAAIRLDDLRDLFADSSQRTMRDWGDMGIKGGWAKKNIHALGLNQRSGTYQLFHGVILRGMDRYADTVTVFDNAWDLMANLSEDPLGMGYCGVGLAHYWQNQKDKSLKLLPIALDAKLPIEPTRNNCLNGEYPLARSLYIYMGNRPGDVISSVQQEFFRYIFSQQGQNIVVRQGMFALQAAMAEKMMRLAQGRMNHF